MHALVKKQTRSNTTPGSAPVWHDHLHRHFRVARTSEEPRPSAVDMAVPCSKNHPPPEVLSFRRGEQSGEFEIPDLSVLEGVVCCQFQKLSAGASSGFDAIPILS